MNLSKAELSNIVDEQRRMLLAAEREVASWRQIVAQSTMSSTHRFALERAERQLAAVQGVAKAVVEYVSPPDTTSGVEAVMAETRRVLRDPDQWPLASIPGKAGIDDTEWWLDTWQRSGERTLALTEQLARLSARGIELGVDVMGEIGPAIKEMHS